MHRSRCFIILVNAWADDNPEHNENASEADQAKANATRLETDLQNSRYEGVDGKKLVSCILARSHTQRPQERRHTRMIRATPSSPICATMPCAVQ
jgi:hypothetical protein